MNTLPVDAAAISINVAIKHLRGHELGRSYQVGSLAALRDLLVDELQRIGAEDAAFCANADCLVLIECQEDGVREGDTGLLFCAECAKERGLTT